MKRFVFVVAIAASAAFVGVSYADSVKRMPSGHKVPGRFGAYYTTLKYDAAWDKPWRIGSHADVVVRFDTGGHKFVFWRGTSYIPCWVTDTDIWYTNEFVERRGSHSPNTEGCCEPMSDKQCRYSHVRIIENTDARTVIHWRYAPVDVEYNHPFIEAGTGWSDWVDEYYFIYPDSVGVRKITAHTCRPDLWMEWHESILLNQPGTMPEDNIELGALSVANMTGQSRTYTWTEKGAPSFGEPKNANILKVNLKATLKPFAIVPPSPAGEHHVITPYGGHGKDSFFNFWDHWPVSQVASDVNLADSTEKPSHSSLCHIGHRGAQYWDYYAKGDNWLTKVMLGGMTGKDVTDLVPLAKSWVNAPKIKAASGCKTLGYDQAKREYPLVATAGKITVTIDASKEQPIVNACFTIRNWPDGEKAKVLVNGKEPAEVRQGTVVDTDGKNMMVIWIKIEATKPTEFTISRAHAKR